MIRVESHEIIQRSLVQYLQHCCGSKDPGEPTTTSPIILNNEVGAGEMDGRETSRTKDTIHQRQAVFISFVVNRTNMHWGPLIAM
jgi:hypothetical protein